LAIRFVRWQNDRGAGGMARLTWQVLSGDYNSGYSWQTRWSASIPIAPGTNRITITAEDTKGLDTTQALTFANGSQPAAQAVTFTNGPQPAAQAVTFTSGPQPVAQPAQTRQSHRPAIRSRKAACPRRARGRAACKKTRAR